MRPKLRALFHKDVTEDALVANLAHAFAMVAAKVHAYLCEVSFSAALILGAHRVSARAWLIVVEAFSRVVRYASRVVCRKRQPHLVPAIGYHVFVGILQAKASRYRRLRAWDGLCRMRAEYPLPRAFTGIVDEAVAEFRAKIKY